MSMNDFLAAAVTGATISTTGETMDNKTERLDYLRAQIAAEIISMSELAELQELIPYIPAWDVELLEWAGVPEFPEETVTPWEKQLSNVITAGDSPRLKIVGNINGTNWLELSPSQFEALETFLLSIEDK